MMNEISRVKLMNGHSFFMVELYRWFPSVLKAITIIRPETLVRWHRAGFRRYWRWKSRCLGGRPQIAADLRALIRRMSAENPLWGAPRIHGELLKLGSRQLALQPHLQILRRSRRPLLCGMEQARRPTLAHHVHRTAPMGPRVLINGIWYKRPDPLCHRRAGACQRLWNRVH